MRGIERRNDARIPRHSGEDRVAGSHLGQMHVGFEADPLEGLEPVGGEGVVEEFSHRVWIPPQPLGIDAGGGEVGIIDHRMDPFDQLPGHRAGIDLVAELTLLLRREHAVHPGKESPQGQSHRMGSVSGRDRGGVGPEAPRNGSAGPPYPSARIRRPVPVPLQMEWAPDRNFVPGRGMNSRYDRFFPAYSG